MLRTVGNINNAEVSYSLYYMFLHSKQLSVELDVIISLFVNEIG